MAGRVGRYLRYLKVLLSVVALLLVVNFSLMWYYRYQRVAIIHEMMGPDRPTTMKALAAEHNKTEGQHNGADDLLGAFEAFNDEGINYDLVPVMGAGAEVWPEPGEPFRPEVLAEMNKIVAMNKNSLELLRSAVHAERLQIPMQANVNMAVPSEQFGKVRNAGRLLYVQALCAAETGDIDTAIDSVRTLVSLGDRYAQQPTRLPYLVGVAVMGLGTGVSRVLIERQRITDKAHFEAFSEFFDRTTFGDIASVEWGEGLWAQQYQSNHDLGLEDVRKDLVNESYFGGLAAIGKFAIYLYSFVSDVDALEMWKRIRLIPELAREPLREGLMRAKLISLPTGPFSDRYALTNELLLDDITSDIQIQGHCQSYMRATATAFRVAKFYSEYKRLPNADEYVNVVKPSRDPMDGAALRYRATDDGFIVYSVGPNGADDGGVPIGEEKRTGDFASEFRLSKVEVASPVAN